MNAKTAHTLQALKRFVQNWWPWVLVIFASIYFYRTANPSIDLSRTLGAAPDFEALDLEGQVFRLSDQKGKIVVLNFWATWCPPCRAEIPGFKDLQEEMRKNGVVFVGVSLDEEGFDVVRPYAQKHRINYSVVVDHGQVARSYGGISTLPTTYIIDGEGNIRYQHTGLLLKGALRSALQELVHHNK